MAYVTRTHGERPHAKFQPPTMTGLAVHKGHTRVQNKGNANIYVDYPDFPFESFDSTATMVIFLGLGCNNYGTMVLPWM